MHRLVLFLLPAILGGCGASWSTRDEDGDGVTIADGDCNDSPDGGGDVGPGAPETWYDGVDQNCDGLSDFDKDGDGFDSVEGGGTDCWDDPDVVPGDFEAINGFPALTAADVHPDAVDAFYDGIDANCDGASDFDADADGYDSANPDHRQRDGSLGDDCYDSAELDEYPESGEGDWDFLPEDVNPGQTETWYDGTDADCDGASDFDQDGDGFNVDSECDDLDAAIYPNPDIEEIWYDGVDQNCDGNDGDKDGDGYYAADYPFEVPAFYEATDCWDDSDTIPTGYDALNGYRQLVALEVNPDAVDQPYDGIDADCAGDSDFDFDDDGVATEDWPARDGSTGADCDDGDSSTYPGASDTWYDGTDSDCAGDSDYDADRDGYDASDRISTGTDCDDADAAINPAPTTNEDCSTPDDDNCDGSLDLQNADNCDVYYYDGDGDGYGSTTSQCWCEPQVASNYDATVSTDCNDSAAGTNPGATEICDAANTDEDCDGVADNNDSSAASSGKTTFYHDDDRDGYGDLTHAGAAYCDNPSTSSQAWVTDRTDCDDASPTDYPGASETVANGDDEDCDGVDSCYQDLDGDNYGTTTVVDGSSLDCASGTGSAVATDCDDSSATVYPSAAETVADGIDQDCDSVDSCYQDLDNDNYGTTTVVDGSSLNCTTGTGAPVSTDCDDTSSSIYPGASETVADGIDQDCDSVDSCYQDSDNDNYGTTTVVDGSSLNCTTGTGAPVSTDCNDASSSIYPGASETVADGIDQDCDNVDSCYQDSDNDNYGTTTVVDGSSLNCTTGTGAPNDDDCNDASSSIYLGATETVADGIDQDCDNVDSCYQDSDNDNYGTTTVVDGSSLNCTTGTGAPVSTDCDDSSSSVYPGANETVADGIDQDCDSVDTCYTDADGDNYGTTTTTDGSSLNCTTGTGAPVSTDCDDTNSLIYPGASETVADGIDQDCDNVDSCYQDSDSDNYGTTTVVDGSSLSCASGTGAPVSTDCDDSSSSIYPGAPETVADGIDQDCDSVDTCYVDADGDNYGTTSTTDGSSLSCATGTGAANDDDCEDGDGDIYPGAPDPTDGTLVDEDCDGLVDEDDLVEGDVVITEFFVGAGGTYEWVEIYNNAGVDLDLLGWTFTACSDSDANESLPYTCDTDNNTTTGTYEFGNLEIPSGAYAVICDTSSAFTTAADCDAVWDFSTLTNIDADNGGFYLVVGSLTVDEVNYWTTAGSDDWPSSSTISVQFSDALLDVNAFSTNDDWSSDGSTADQWCLSTEPTSWDAGDNYYGTPGSANATCVP